jgi:outer membrane protein OmpA-like peptidoglycan-associated protein
VAALRLDLKRSDGGAVHLTAGRLGDGAQKIFDIKQPEGVFQYDGTLIARFPHGPPQTLPVQFEAAVLPPPRLTVPEKPVDLVGHTVAIVADRPIAELNVQVHADDGTLADDVTEKFAIRATDKYGFFQNIDLFPWKIEIPHEDVLFDTGKSDVLPTEQPKVDAALAELNKAIEKYGRYAKVELFVAGYTDTVGDAASNRKLSEARALSIARDFRASARNSSSCPRRMRRPRPGTAGQRTSCRSRLRPGRGGRSSDETGVRQPKALHSPSEGARPA